MVTENGLGGKICNGNNRMCPLRRVLFFHAAKSFVSISRYIFDCVICLDVGISIVFIYSRYNYF